MNLKEKLQEEKYAEIWSEYWIWIWDNICRFREG